MKRVSVVIAVLLLLMTGCGDAKVQDTALHTAMTEGSAIEETQKTEVEEAVSSWVEELDIAQTVTQMIVVSAKGSYAMVSMHTQDDNGIWQEEFSVLGRIGRNGIDKEKEGDEKTPTGVYHFTNAFGILEDPGITTLPYLQIDETHYWVDDSDSKYYNQLVSTQAVKKEWNSAEKLSESIYSYKYVLALDYNEACVPGAGSAIFLHCPSRDFEGTSGCIAIPTENMVEVLQKLRSDCVIIIDSEENIANY